MRGEGEFGKAQWGSGRSCSNECKGARSATTHQSAPLFPVDL